MIHWGGKHGAAPNVDQLSHRAITPECWLDARREQLRETRADHLCQLLANRPGQRLCPGSAA